MSASAEGALLTRATVPTPQEFSLKEIPGDDPLHQFQYPTTSDVR
jgi:hypothetical protein